MHYRLAGLKFISSGAISRLKSIMTLKACKIRSVNLHLKCLLLGKLF